MLGRECLELRHQSEVTAEGELGVDALLDGGEPLFLEPVDVDPRELFELEIREWTALPERLPLTERPGRTGKVARRTLLPALGDHVLEHL